MTDPARRTRARSPVVSPNWTPGRSNAGGGYDPATMGTPQGDGAPARRPATRPGACSTSAATLGWSLGEIARYDLEYLEWLDRMPIGRTYQAEIDDAPADARTAGQRRRRQATSRTGTVPPPLSDAARARGRAEHGTGRYHSAFVAGC